MPRAIWKGVVIAEAPADVTKVVSGHVYFPPEAVRRRFLRPSDKSTWRFGKGVAIYYDVRVAGELNRDAAWSYLCPADVARKIAGHIAFWRGVVIER